MSKTVKIVRKAGIEEITLENPRQAILVGTSREIYYSSELDLIADAVKNAGMHVLRTESPWPRNLYVALGDTYLPVSEFGDAARGGAYLSGKGFALASEDTEELIKTFHSGTFNGLSFHYLPNFDLRFVFQDLDYYLGIVKGKNLFVVDERYYRRNSNALERICQRYKQNILTLPPDEFNLLPANLLEIGTGGKTQVIMNGIAVNSIALIEKKGIKVVSKGLYLVELPFEGCGSVRCATNFVHDGALLPYLGVKLNGHEK